MRIATALEGPKRRVWPAVRGNLALVTPEETDAELVARATQGGRIGALAEE